ncbi:hypothetical protein EVG20_g688 [Dentipellis fragilis]|uniref:Uncharacterized protein n=1 Tax=Dentipellis fragilis TaxID=205917 RepID=A0A4Y9ZCL0_9AGAM|nr:hypothetical protein EVG20_g688 [Dentipellis fragilis]
MLSLCRRLCSMFRRVARQAGHQADIHCQIEMKNHVPAPPSPPALAAPLPTPPSYPCAIALLPLRPHCATSALARLEQPRVLAPSLRGPNVPVIAPALPCRPVSLSCPCAPAPHRYTDHGRGVGCHPTRIRSYRASCVAEKDPGISRAETHELDMRDFVLPDMVSHTGMYDAAILVCSRSWVVVDITNRSRLLYAMAFKAGEADNWVVADSEDEDSFDLGEQPPRVELNMPQTVSQIETAPSVEVEKATAATYSTISTFTNPQPQPAGNSTISSYTPNVQYSNPPKARPRPRPIFKGSKSDSTAPTSDATSLILQTPSSERMPPPTVIVNNNSIPLTIPDKGSAAADFSLDIAERAKMRSRNAKKPLQREEVIELTSDEEMPAPPPKPKAKPKARPVKRAKVDHPNPGDVSIAESAATTIPVASSSFPLPPSDPYTSSPEKRAEILAGLNSPAQQTVVQEKKRVTIPRIQRESDGGIAGPAGVPMDIDQETTAPPPPFFAPSTEVQGPSRLEDDLPPVSAEKGKKAKKGAKKAADEGTAKAKPKAKASKTASKQLQVEVLIETSPKKGKGASKTVDHQAEASLPKPDSSSASKKNPASKKRRRVDDSDSELSAVDDSEEDELQLVPASKTKAKKPASRKAASGGTKGSKGKGKAVPVDEEPQARGQKRARTGRGAVLSEEEEAEVAQAPPSRNRSGKATDKDKGSKGTNDAELAQRDDPDARPLAKGKDKPNAPETPARSKENVSPESSNGSGAADSRPSSSTKEMTSSSSGRKYTFSRPSKPTPMQELIRRANSHPNSPFTPSPRASYHSPLAKTSKSLLRKIAPLHPNRKSPPPPLPPPPPPKKSKKMLQLEEKWEMELEESVEGWFALSDARTEGVEAG